jgi:hypothetical protein
MLSVCARRAALAILLGCASAAPAFGQDKLKLAIGQIDAWANQVPTLGMRAGIFQKHGIVLENFGTQGAGETLQAVISGSADIGIGSARRASCAPSPKARRYGFWPPAIPASATFIGSCRWTRRSRR